MKILRLILILVFASLIGCTSDGLESSEVQPVPRSENLNLDFNKWIYSQMNHNYLWREDMPDSLECNYDLEPTKFYSSLLSSKDRFSYCGKNDYYSPSARNSNVGYEYQTYVIESGEEIRKVLYVTSRELKEKGLKRGDVILSTDDSKQIVRVDLDKNKIVSVDTLEATNPFEPINTVCLDSIYYINGYKIGYLCYLQFEYTDDLVPSFKRFYDTQIDEMILDLRYNPGGYVSTCKYLSNSLVNEKGYNEIFQQCTYNDVLTREYERSTGSGITINAFTIPDNGVGVLGNPMYGLNLKRLYVLTSKYSASASEAAIISMRPFMDVIIIGEQTYGKGVGSWTIRDNRFRYQLQPITMRYHNALMETTPDGGLPVDYLVLDGYETIKKELGDIEEPLLAKAIELITEETVEERNDHAKTSNPTRVHSLPRDLNITEVGLPSFFARFKESYKKIHEE